MSTTTNGTLNLEYYRKQARALLKCAKSGDVPALERIALHALPKKRRDLDASTVALNDTQRAIAREQGSPNWYRFRSFVQVTSSDALARAIRFVDAALNDLSEAERIIAEYPEVGLGLIASLVLGDVERVRDLLKLTPESLKEPVGPQNWAPLLYVCFSRFASRASPRRSDIVELGKLLLAHGADPNGSYETEQWPDNPFPCLYGATGLNNNPELAEALIDAGATLDDTESLYHSTEHADLECMKLLLERGANPNSPNVIFHILDREAPEALRLLLDSGADIESLHNSKDPDTASLGCMAMLEAQRLSASSAKQRHKPQRGAGRWPYCLCNGIRQRTGRCGKSLGGKRGDYRAAAPGSVHRRMRRSFRRGSEGDAAAIA